MATKNELRNAVWQACTAIRNEHRDVKKYVEYTAILLFFKFYDDLYESLPSDIQGLIPEKYRWNKLKSLDPRGFHGFNPEVLVLMRDFFENKRWRGESGKAAPKTFGVIFENFQFDIKHSEVLGRALISLDKINFDRMEYDHKGDMYEFLISKMADAGVKGEFFTPRPVVNMIIETLQPKFGHRIWDPACGTGGFLSRAFEEILIDLKQKYIEGTDEYNEALKKLRYDSIYGNETEAVSARLARMNMILRGDGHSTILEFNSLDQQTYSEEQLEIRGEKQANPIPSIRQSTGFDIIIANPPYGGSQAVCDVGKQFKPWNNTKKPESNFIQVMMSMLKEGGRCGVVLPEGILFRREERKIRERLLKQFELEAVVGLFKGAFEFAQDVKACVLFFRKPNKGEKWRGTRKIWFTETKSFSDIVNVPRLLENQEQNELCRFVTIDEINKDQFNLKPSKYLRTISETFVDEIPLDELFNEVKDTIQVRDDVLYKQVTVKLYGKGAILRREISGSEIGTKRQTVVKQGDLIVSKIDARHGALAFLPEELDGAIVTQDFPSFRLKSERLMPELISYYLEFGPISERLQQSAQGTTNRQRVNADDILSLSFPCPPIQEQSRLLQRLDLQRDIMRKAESLLASVYKLDWLDDSVFYHKNEDIIATSLEDLVDDATNLIDPTSAPETEWKVYGVTNDQGVRLSEKKLGSEFKVGRKYKRLIKNAIVYNPQRVNVGSVGIVNETDNESIVSPYYPHFVCKPELDIQFAYFLIKSPYFRKLIDEAVVGAVRHELFFSSFVQIEVPIPNLECQKRIVKEINDQIDSYKQVEAIRNQAENSIRKIIRMLFGISREL